MADAVKGGRFGASIVAGLGLGAGLEIFKGFERGIGDVINAIPDLIQSGEKWAATVDDIADRTGASAKVASEFAGTLQYVGIPLDGIALGLKTLAGEIVNNEDKLNKLGIATRDSNKTLLDTVTVLDNVRSYLSGAQDGAAKMTLAVDLLGKSAGGLIDYFNLTDAEAEALRLTMDELGVTMDEKTRKDAESLKRETNLLGLAWQGLANIISREAMPIIRQAIGGLTDFIKEHGTEIKQVFLDITNAVLGFVSGLAGLSGVTPFQTQLDALHKSGDSVTLSFEQWAQQMGLTIPKLDKVTGSTKGATDAIDKQIDSTQKAIDVEKKRDDASETIFQRTMRRLSAEYGAQLDALDLAEKQIAIADRRRDLNDQLNQAQLDLASAQQGKGGAVNAQDVSSAMAKVADIQRQQAENERQLAVAAQRERLEGVKTYIEDVAKIEADADNKKALAKTLARRREKLADELATAQAAKNEPDIKDITARMAAVAEAEKRTAAAIKSGDKQDELGKLKSSLEEQRRAIQAAGAGQVSDNQKTLDDMHTAYDKWVAQQTTSTRTYTGMFADMVHGDPKKGTGIGGSIAKAFADGEKAGKSFRDFLNKTLGPAIKGIVDGLGFVIDKLNEIGTNKIFKVLFVDVGAAFDSGTPQGGRGGPGRGGAAGPVPSQPLIKPLADFLISFAHSLMGNTSFNTDKFPTRASGGPVIAGIPFIGNERRQEFFVPSQSGTIIPSLAAMSGFMGSQTIEVPVYLDGQVLTRVVSHHQERSRSR